MSRAATTSLGPQPCFGSGGPGSQPERAAHRRQPWHGEVPVSEHRPQPLPEWPEEDLPGAEVAADQGHVGGPAELEGGMDDLDLPGEVRGRLLEYADGGFVTLGGRVSHLLRESGDAGLVKRAVYDRHDVFDILQLIEIKQPGNHAGPLTPAVPPGYRVLDSAQRDQVAGALITQNVPPAAASPGLAAGINPDRIAASSGNGSDSWCGQRTRGPRGHDVVHRQRRLAFQARHPGQKALPFLVVINPGDAQDGAGYGRFRGAALAILEIVGMGAERGHNRTVDRACRSVQADGFRVARPGLGRAGLPSSRVKRGRDRFGGTAVHPDQQPRRVGGTGPAGGSGKQFSGQHGKAAFALLPAIC